MTGYDTLKDTITGGIEGLTGWPAEPIPSPIPDAEFWRLERDGKLLIIGVADHCWNPDENEFQAAHVRVLAALDIPGRTEEELTADALKRITDQIAKLRQTP